MSDPRVRTSFLLYHLAMVDYSAQYLAKHTDRLQHSMLPFGELFVVNNNAISMELIPNPRLIGMMSNNLAPTMAGVLLQKRSSASQLTSQQIETSVIEAKRRRIFQAQIGKFNNYDPRRDTVEFDAIFNRTCPAMEILTTSMKAWLPQIYNRHQDNR